MEDGRRPAVDLLFNLGKLFHDGNTIYYSACWKRMMNEKANVKIVFQSVKHYFSPDDVTLCFICKREFLSFS